jgi:prevent-host-death family protein
MAKARTVGVRDLKNRLSSHLRDVRDGLTITVSDRGHPVAELRPRPEREAARAADRAAEWAREGRLEMPTIRKRPLDPSPVSLRAGTAKRMLEADRAEA